MRRGILLVMFVLCLGAASGDLCAQTVFVSTGQGTQILSPKASQLDLTGKSMLPIQPTV